MNQFNKVSAPAAELIERIGRGEVPRFGELFSARKELEGLLTRIRKLTLRRRLAIALGKGLRRVTPGIRAVLSEAIADEAVENLTERLRAIETLSYLSESDDELLDALLTLAGKSDGERNDEVAEAAVRTLGWIGFGRLDVAQTIAHLAVTGPPGVRAAAVHALGRIAASVPISGGWFVERLLDADDTVREAAVVALARFDQADTTAGRAVLKVAQTGTTKTTREAAVAALGTLGRGDVVIAKQLASMIEGAGASMRKRCVRTIEQIGVHHRTVLGAIYPVLHDQQVENVLAAIRAIAALGRGNVRALTELTKLARTYPTDDNVVGLEVRQAVRELQAGADHLIGECLQQWDLPMRDEALRRVIRLVRHDPDAGLAEVVRRIEESAEGDPDRERLQLMLCAVARELGEAVRETAPLLANWLTASRPVADQAELALRAIGSSVRGSIRDDSTVAAGGDDRPWRNRYDVAMDWPNTAPSGLSRSSRLWRDQVCKEQWKKINEYDNVLSMSKPRKSNEQDGNHPNPLVDQPPDGTKTVVDMLKENRSVDEIRDHLRRCVAPSAKELIESTDKDGRPCSPLNDWIRSQNSSTWAERVATTSFINDLLSAVGVAAEHEGKSCYLLMSKKPRYPEGVIYVMPHGAKHSATSRIHFADLPSFQLQRVQTEGASSSADGEWVRHLDVHREPGAKPNRR